MAKTKSKSNIEILRDIHKEMAAICPLLVTEAEEFLDAIEKENTDKADEIIKLKEDIDDLERDDDDDPVMDNSDFVGLDTIHWGLDKGNLNIQMRMEAFVKEIKRENLVGANPY